MKTFFTQTTLQRVFVALAFFMICPAFTNVHAQCSYFTKIVTSPSSVHTLGLKNDGTLWAWGDNQASELGDGTTIQSNIPEQIGTATNWTDITIGFGYSLGITADGKLWGWGTNSIGQLGDGTGISYTVPTQIGTATNWVSVNACISHSFGITADGRLWGTGYGILGLPSGNTSNIFVPITADNDWASVSTGNYHTLALKKDGSLWAWGRNAEGETGDGNTDGANVYTPERIGTGNNWVKIAAGYDHSMGIKSDGTLWTWGQNNEAELGNGTTINGIHGPEQIGTAANWIAIAGGYQHSLGVTADGKLWGWGDNSIGELGDGVVYENGSIKVPLQIGTATNWVAVSCGEQFSLGLTANGYAWGMGRNIEGELGDNSIINKFAPTNIGIGPVYAGLATSGLSSTLYQNSVDFYATDCAHLIAKVVQGGSNPISGNTTAKVWIDPTIQADGNGKPYLQRHYQVTPVNNAGTATAMVTLYFTQAEFTLYNAQPNVVNGTYPKLPVNAADAEGYRANLNFTKISGTSSDGSGAPASYSGTETLITPTTVIYQNGQWEATFNTTGFSGFFGATGLNVLPLTWINITAALNSQQQAQVSWQVQEQNVESYTIEKSTDGRNFSTLAVVAGKGDGLNSYQFKEPKAMAGTAFYRIKQTGKDGKFSYSTIVQLTDFNAQGLSLFPNPGSDHLFINGLQVNTMYHVTVIDMLGKTILTKEIASAQNEIFTNVLGKGIYLVKVTANGTGTTLKFVKK